MINKIKGCLFLRRHKFLKDVSRSLIIALYLFAAAPTHAAPQIIVDGKTATTLNITGNTTNITTTSIYSGNALNSYSKFDVNQGNTVNLHVPNAAQRLINVVNGNASRLDGVLNGYKNGVIGGNVYFLNPNGVFVGSTGVLNFGTLHLSTPTQAYIDSFFNPDNSPNSTALTQLLNGSLPISDSAEVNVEGKINTLGQLRFLTGNSDISGALSSGQYGFDEMSSIVNLGDLDADVVATLTPTGEIEIIGRNNVTVTGTISASEDVTLQARSTTISSVNLNTATINGDAVTITASAEATSLIGLIDNDVSASVILNGATINATESISINAVAISDQPTLISAVVDTPNASTTILVADSNITAGEGVALTSNSNVTSIVDIPFLEGIATPLDVAVSVTNSNASTKLQGNTSITAGDEVSVSSTASSDVASVAKTALTPAAGAVAVSVVHNSADSSVEGETQISTTGAVSINSTTTVIVDTVADASAAGETSGGLGIAVTYVNNESRAALTGNADVTNSASVEVHADSFNQVNTAARAAVNDPAEGAESETVSTLQDAGVSEETTDEITAALGGSIGMAQEHFSEDADGDGEGDGGPQAAAAIAVTVIENNVESLVGGSGTTSITSAGNLDLQNQSLSHISNLASGVSGGGTVGGGAGVSVLVVNNTNRARLQGEGSGTVNISAGGVNVNALTALHDEELSDLENNAYSSLAIAGQGGGEVGLAGAVAITIADNNLSEAIIGDGVTLELNDGAVTINSDNKTESIVSANTNMDEDEESFVQKFFALFTQGEEEDDGDDTPNVGIGAAIAINVGSNDVTATLSGDTTLNNVTDLTVSATGQSEYSTEAHAAGEGGVSIVPTLALSIINDDSIASIESSDSILNLGGDVSISAEQESSVKTVADGVAEGGDTVGIGMSVGITLANANAIARIDRDINTTGDVTVAAQSLRSFSAGATAGNGGGAEDEETPDEEENNVGDSILSILSFANEISDEREDGDDADSADSADVAQEGEEGGSIGIAAALGLAVTNTVTEASVASNRSISANNISIVTLDNTDSSAAADGSAAGETASVGVAVAINIANVKNQAVVASNASVSGETVNVSAANLIDPILYEEGDPILHVEGEAVLDEFGDPVLRDEDEPILDEEDEPVLDDDGFETFYEGGEAVLYAGGEPVLDAGGEPVLYEGGEPVLDEEGEPTFDETSHFEAKAVAGAGAANVGIAGGVAINIVTVDTVADIQSGVNITTVSDTNITATANNAFVADASGVVGEDA
ncbi:MAG: leukotoxin LktA family filamentous adhesin, partial [Spongiibacteraceae bacterium]|nr:leukotoxin LktA family filamentous adhesin [Spongiibacteraceae bacterium]